MKRLLFAIAGAAAFSAFAADPTAGANDISIVGFENYTADQTVVGYGDSGTQGDNSLWSVSPLTGEDASLVKTYAGGDIAAPNITEPAPFEDAAENAKYLALDTNGSELRRAIPAAGQAIAADGTYIDTLVQFTPSESAPTAADLNGAKLAIWLGVDSVNNTTNLMVQAGIVAADGTVSSHEYKLNASAEPNTWYRLTVTALKNITKVPADQIGNGFINGFQIKLDGTPLAAATDTAFAEEYITNTLLDQDWGWLNAETDAATLTLLRSNTLFPSIAGVGSDDTLTAVGFKGTGALDDFVVTTEAPTFGPAAIDFTLTWPAGLTAVSYSIDGGAAVAISGASPLSIPNLVGGEAITFIVQNADGAQKTLSATAANGEGIDATGTTFGWAEYLGDAVSGAYEIDDLDELILFQKGVAAGLATANTTFKQTADIALTAAWEGIGIKAGKDLVNGSTKDIPAYEAGAFCGTFDGQNHTISNFQMENGTDYGAFFNSVNGALISNLKISFKENKLCADSSATGGDTGAAFVGVARFSTLQNLTALATQDVDTVSASKDMAGIVGYLMAGSTVDSCTNELNVASLLTAKARKSGGIALITQDGTGTATIQNCKNSGTVTLANAGGQSGGIVGYVGQSTTIIDCENTATVKMLTIMGSASLTVQGTNKGNATVASCNVATNGLNFATVDGDVATFVADDALALNGSYKVMTTGATATFAFAEAGTIAFDTALFTPTFAITAAEGLTLTDATSGTVKTYTAASQGVDIEPGQQDATVYTTSEEATAALANVTIVEPDDVKTNETITAQAKADYDALFAAKVVEVSGGYAIEVGLTAAAETALQTQANGDAAEIVDAINESTVTFAATPGLYYSIEYGTSLSLGSETAKVMATGSTLTLDMPTKPAGATSGFYKVKISVTK